MRLPAGRLLRLALGVAVVVTGLVVAVGVLLGDPSDPARPAAAVAVQEFETVPLDRLDLAGLSFPRATFCEAIDAREVEAALGAGPVGSENWSPGDQVDLPVGGSDVGAEFGCRYAAMDGTAASAWVFGPPVTPTEAADLGAAAARARPGACTAGTTTTDLPLAPVVCRTAEGGSATYHGLLGDAWFSCQIHVSDPSADPLTLTDRTSRWCAGVVRSVTPGAID